ncbi:MAG: LptF/LptG family permease [Planctomycetota bacterium]|jgi:lipopolysaccharide export system permease protein
MKILDRYVAKNFLMGYFIALFVLLGMFLTIDLFLNLDEFSEQMGEVGADGNVQTLTDVIGNVVRFYSIRCSLWYKDLAGMVIVIAAVFSLSRMTQNNELIAVMASGMSLKRILAPILFLSLMLTGLMVIDQEFVIPRFAQELTRDHDEIKQDAAPVRFLNDGAGSLFYSWEYDAQTMTMQDPLILLREKQADREGVYRTAGKIQAKTATYDPEREGWVLAEGKRQIMDPENEQMDLNAVGSQAEPISFYPSDLTAGDVSLRLNEGFKSLLSLRHLTKLEKNPGTRKSDMADLALQKHSRITDPIINLIMLMVALPVLVCRDPKTMKTAILISFLTTASCFLVVFVCKLFATEVIFGAIRPALWSWAPVFIFFPIALIEIDSMRT